MLFTPLETEPINPLIVWEYIYIKRIPQEDIFSSNIEMEKICNNAIDYFNELEEYEKSKYLTNWLYIQTPANIDEIIVLEVDNLNKLPKIHVEYFITRNVDSLILEYYETFGRRIIENFLFSEKTRLYQYMSKTYKTHDKVLMTKKIMEVYFKTVKNLH